MLPLIQKEQEATVPSRTVASLHEYLQANTSQINVASRLLTDLHSNKGTGKIFVSETNNILYYYGGNSIYHVFSRGGRYNLFMVRPALALTASRTKIIHKRFLSVNNQSEDHLVNHFERMIELSGAKEFSDLSRSLIQGEFTVHMRDLQTPFIEIGKDEKGIPLVVPLDLITALASLNVLPHTSVKYMGQHILLATNEDYTIRTLYASHLLDDKLFVP